MSDKNEIDQDYENTIIKLKAENEKECKCYENAWERVKRFCPIHGGAKMNDKKAKVSKEDFLAYEEVRISGLTNMLMIRTVEDLSGVDRNVIKEIIKNYANYAKKFLPKRYKEISK